MEIRQSNFPLKNETDLIISTAIEIHNFLGCGFLEIVYKGAFCIELKNRDYFYKKKSYTKFIIKVFSYPIAFMPTLLYLTR